MLKISDLFNTKAYQVPQAPAEIKKKILVIEDELDISQIYQEILSEAGFNVYSATNGEEGLRKIVEITPNLIFLDLRMPIMDGKTMLAYLKNDAKYALYKKIPVVILTNSGRSDNIRDTIRLGEAADFIIKANIVPNEIVDIAKKYV